MEALARDFRMALDPDLLVSGGSDGKNHRQTPWVEVENPSVKTKSRDFTIVNFSKNGMFLASPQNIESHVGLEINFKIFDLISNQENPIKGRAKVKWVRSQSKDTVGPSGIGIKVIDMDEGSYRTYRTFFEDKFFNLLVKDLTKKVDLIVYDDQWTAKSALFGELFSKTRVKNLFVCDEKGELLGALDVLDVSQKKEISLDKLRPISHVLMANTPVKEVIPILRDGVYWDFPVFEGKDFVGVMPVDQLFYYSLAWAENSYKTSLNRYESYLYEVAHDLRQPIGYIHSVHQLINQQNLSLEEISELSRSVNSVCERTLTLIDQILDVPRLRSGRIKLNNTEIDIERVLRDIIERVRVRWAGRCQSRPKNVDIEYQSSFQMPIPFMIDEVRLEQVVSNILVNALQHSPDNSVVKVVLGPDDQVDTIGITKTGIVVNGLKICFQDQGQGISSDILNELKQENLEYVHSKTHNISTESTGIGLKIVQNIVKAMQGSLTFISDERKGTKVILHLKSARV